MTHDDEQCLNLGRMVVRMIRDLQIAGNDAGYGRQTVTFPGGEMHVILANSAELADAMEAAAREKYDVKDATPPSQRN
jgi:hypothetical protein